MMKVRYAVALLLVIPAVAAAQKPHKSDHVTYPAHVLIIRHAEKPTDSDASLDLAPAGFARAKALPQLFVESPQRRYPLPVPSYIFAASDTKHSHRPLETVSPLAAALHLTVNTKFADDDAHALARELLGHKKYEGQTVLVVWHQGKIPKLAKALGATEAPGGWNDKVFDRVWALSFGETGKVLFQSLPQHLMPGDSSR